MNQKATGSSNPEPALATVTSLTADFAALGVQSGMTLLVHSSLKALGPVCGGPVAVILALEKLLGPAGTLVMPTFSHGLSEPAYWKDPPVPESWWETIRQEVPAFDIDLTPTLYMGAISECFRKQAGVRRSNHPHVSFAAWGKHAALITEGQVLEDGLGETSSLARIYDLNGWVLLLGVGHGNNSSLHLSEHRANFTGKKRIIEAAPILVDGQRQWVSFEQLDLDDADFELLGAAFKSDTELEQRGPVGAGQAILIPQKNLVDYGVGWLEHNR